MFVRTSTRRNKDGTPVRYLQLAHNEWDPTRKASRTKVVYNFGRAEELDRAGIERLIGALSRLLGTQPPAAGDQVAGLPGLEFAESRPLGGTWLLDQLWHRLGIDMSMQRLLAGTRRPESAERVLFALVANRALAPSSKLAAAGWVSHDVHVPGLPEVSEDACYRAMDWLLQVEDTLARNVYDSVADLYNLEVDLLFFDTTSTHFQVEEPDIPVPRDVTGQRVDAPADDADHTGAFRTWGKSKDHRDDLPQVVIGMAVTRTGIPVRVWSWPGNTTDTALIRQVKTDLRDWTLGKVVWVADRGFTSTANRRALAAGAGGYILAEKLRSGSAEATAALSRPGRYATVADNLRVKEVRISDTSGSSSATTPTPPTGTPPSVRTWSTSCAGSSTARTPSASGSGRSCWGDLHQARPEPLPARHPQRSAAHRPGRHRSGGEAGRQVPAAHLRPTPESAEDVALGYKQLAAIENAWRDMKHVIDLRPVFHRLEDRIRAHVLLCWLALLLIRIVETRTGTTWHQLRPALQRLHVGTFTGPAGTYQQTTTPSTEATAAFQGLGLQLPPKVLRLDTPAGPAKDSTPAA